jgi:hypothetical protein
MMEGMGKHPSDSRSSDRAAVTFRERLWPGPLGWFLVIGFAGFIAIAVLPVDPAVALVAAAITALAGAVVAVRTSPVVAVVGGELRAGRARIPVGLLGQPRPLDRAGIRTALGPGSDARAHVCLRAWIGSAVEVPLLDPADPTPSWLVSSRRPSTLVAALEAARGKAQAAHSEQIG